jgi:hypothetical protein
MLPPGVGAVAPPEQLARNAVYSRIQGSSGVSRSRPGCSYLLVHRIALPHAVGLSAQFAGAQNDVESRPRVG